MPGVHGRRRPARGYPRLLGTCLPTLAASAVQADAGSVGGTLPKNPLSSLDTAAVACIITSGNRRAYNATSPTAIYTSPDQQANIVLTRPDQSDLEDDDLLDAAITEAGNADIVDASTEDSEAAYPRLTMTELLNGLSIGEWTE